MGILTITPIFILVLIVLQVLPIFIIAERTPHSFALLATTACFRSFFFQRAAHYHLLSRVLHASAVDCAHAPAFSSSSSSLRLRLLLRELTSSHP